MQKGNNEFYHLSSREWTRNCAEKIICLDAFNILLAYIKPYYNMFTELNYCQKNNITLNSLFELKCVFCNIIVECITPNISNC